MKYIFLYIFFFFVFVLTFNACTHNDFNTRPNIPDGMRAIELNLKVQNQAGSNSLRSTSTGATLRALGEEPGNKYNNALNENKIDNIEVFIFHADGSLKKRVPASELQQIGNENRVTLRILVANAQVPQYENQRFKIVVVANATVVIPAAVASLDDLQNVLQETTNINKTDTPQAKFLMDGELDATPFIWGSEVIYHVSGELPLRRAAAKIRLRIREVNVNVTANNQTVHFYVVIQIFRVLFFNQFLFLLLYQEVEEDAGSAGEQPVSNKLPALHCNMYRG